MPEGSKSRAGIHALSACRMPDGFPLACFASVGNDKPGVSDRLCHALEFRRTEADVSDRTNLRIDPQRLWDTLMETAGIGGTPKGGIRRLALSDEDRRVRDWFRAQCEALGCTVAVDEVGTMFATRPGRLDIPPVCMGSHLDTQPTGGKFDGNLGVLGGLEVLRTLHQADYQTNAPITLVNWTNEEGSRFSPAMIASAVFAGAFTADYARAQKDREGVSFGEALDAIGYRGAEPAGARKIGAMFELHIEQGPILEDESRMIGVVTGVQGIRWYEVTVRGQDAHTGATPMRLRRNALLGAARVMEAIEQIAQAHAPDAVGAVGLIENRPNSRNVVPGEVRAVFNIRFNDLWAPDSLAAAIRSRVATAAGAADVETDDVYRARIVARIQEPPGAGTRTDYLRWALAVPGVERAFVFPAHLGLGSVGVAVLGPAGALPDAPLVAAVQAALDANRPVTALALAFAPPPSVVNLTLTIAPDTAAQRALVQAAIAAFFATDPEPGVPLRLSRLSEAISATVGETWHRITAPAADVVVGSTSLAVLGTVTFA